MAAEADRLILDNRGCLVDLSEKIIDLELAHHELASVVWGDDKKRDNGLRSKVNKMCEIEIPELKTTVSVLQGCLDDQRGKLETHIVAHKETRKDESTIRAEKIKTYGAIVISLIGNAATILTVLLTRGK